MNNLNSIIIEGNLVADPEFKVVRNDIMVVNFAIGYNRSIKREDTYFPEVSFFSVEAWDKLAEKIRDKAQKGTGVRIVGRLKQHRWCDPDGRQRSRVVIVADHVEFKSKTREVFNEPS